MKVALFLISAEGKADRLEARIWQLVVPDVQQAVAAVPDAQQVAAVVPDVQQVVAVVPDAQQVAA
ncbi:hypothetical protein, partial [Tardiphaga sp. P5_C10]